MPKLPRIKFVSLPLESPFSRIAEQLRTPWMELNTRTWFDFLEPNPTEVERARRQIKHDANAGVVRVERELTDREIDRLARKLAKYKSRRRTASRSDLADEDRTDSTGQSDEGHGEQPSSAKLRSGPWSAMPMIEEELRRRARAGECMNTCAKECKELGKWADKHFKRDELKKLPGAPKPKTIRNVLADLYYELNPETPRPKATRDRI